MQTEVEGQVEFTLVKALARHRVLDVSMGPLHSAVLVEPGHVYTFGKNSEGQLGNGNTKPQSAPIAVKIFQEKPAFVGVLCIMKVTLKLQWNSIYCKNKAIYTV